MHEGTNRRSLFVLFDFTSGNLIGLDYNRQGDPFTV